MENIISNVVTDIDSKKELKHFRISFVFFLFGLLMMIASLASVASIRGGVPREIQYLSYLSNIGIILFIVASMIVKKSNVNFLRSIYCLIAFFLLSLVSEMCSSSTNSLFHSMAEGFDISSSILLCLYFVEYLIGCKAMFTKYQFTKGTRIPLITIIVFTSIFALGRICSFIAGLDVVLRYFYVNRTFYYLGIGLNILSYVYIFIASIIAMIYINKQVRKVLKDERK